MNCRAILLSALFGLGMTSAALAQSPGELRGKSVTASWTEEREQRSGGQTAFTLKSTPQSLIVYISTEGRLFTRRTAYSASTSSQPRASGSRENLGNSGGNQASQIHGHSLTVTNKMEGGVRMTRIDFSADFTTCTASVIVGRDNPGTIVRSKNWSQGGTLEFKSAKVTGTSCSIQNGNALGS